MSFISMAIVRKPQDKYSAPVFSFMRFRPNFTQTQKVAPWAVFLRQTTPFSVVQKDLSLNYSISSGRESTNQILSLVKNGSGAVKPLDLSVGLSKVCYFCLQLEESSNIGYLFLQLLQSGKSLRIPQLLYLFDQEPNLSYIIFFHPTQVVLKCPKLHFIQFDYDIPQFSRSLIPSQDNSE